MLANPPPFFTNFYGLDWLAFGLTLAAFLLIGNQNKWGFLLQICGHLAWAAIGLLTQSSAMVIANLLFGLIAIRNFYKWNVIKT